MSEQLYYRICICYEVSFDKASDKNIFNVIQASVLLMLVLANSIGASIGASQRSDTRRILLS